MFTLIKNANPLLVQGQVSKDGAAKLAAFFAEIDTVLAIKPSPMIAASGKITVTSQVRGNATVMPDESLDTEKRLEAEVQAKIEARLKARAEKDFARADAIRRELLDMGIVLEDTKDGVRWKKAGPPKA